MEKKENHGNNSCLKKEGCRNVQKGEGKRRYLVGAQRNNHRICTGSQKGRKRMVQRGGREFKKQQENFEKGGTGWENVGEIRGRRLKARPLRCSP